MERKSNAISRDFNQRWLNRRLPVTGLFELTPRCTLDCKMCYVHMTPEQMGERRELSTEQWLKIVDEAVEAGLLTAALTGGECMMHPGFWEIYSRLRNSGVITSVNTNAFALTDAQIARFCELQPSSIRITLYGASAEDYARLTGHGEAFARVVENIKKLRAAGLRVKLASTLTKYNASSMWKIYDLARDLGLRLGITAELYTPYEETGREVESASLSREELLEFLLAYKKHLGREPFRNEPIPELPSRRDDLPPEFGMRCGSGNNFFFLHWDGTLAPCFNFKGKCKVHDVGFAAAWEAAKQEAAAYPQPVECLRCKLLQSCTPCVFLRQNPKDPGHANPERCRLTLEQYNRGLTTLDQKAAAADESARLQLPDEC